MCVGVLGSSASFAPSASLYVSDKDDDDSNDRDRKDRKEDRKPSKERSSKDKVSC